MRETTEVTQWYTPKQAMEIVKIGRTKFYECLRAGSIRAWKIGGAWRIPASEIHGTAFLRQQASRAEDKGRA